MRIGRNCLFLMIVMTSFCLASPLQAETVISLDQARQMALSNNHDIKNMEETLKRVEVAIQSAWSILLPNINARGNITRNDKEISFPTVPTATVIQEKWTQGASISGQMTLFSPASIPLIMNAHGASDATKEDIRHGKSELLYAVTSIYYAAVQARKLIEVSQQAVKRAEEFVSLSEARLAAGISIRLEVLRAEMDLSDAEKTLIQAETAYGLAKQSLALLIVRATPYEVESPKRYPELPSENIDELLEQAEKQRLDLKAARMRITLAERSSLQTWMEFLPDFYMQGSHDWSSVENFGGAKKSWRILFVADLPIFEGGRRIADLRDKAALERIAENDASKLADGIVYDVHNAMLELRRSKAQLQASRKKLELARENYAMVISQYEAGLVDNLTMVDASTMLLQSELGLAGEELSVQLATLTVRQRAGYYITAE